MKKHLAIAGIVTAVSAASITGVGIANAATDTNSTDPMSSLVTAISTKFNLSKTDVQKVFDEQRTTMQAERETKAKEEVAQLVKDGKLTQAQADAINAKRAEMKKEREEHRTADRSTMTDEKRKAEMESHKTELNNWAEENNIPAEYLRYVMGGGHRGPGGHGGPRG